VKARIGASLSVGIGAPIPFAALADIKDRQALVDHLRERTYALALPTAARKRPGRKLIQAIKRLKNLKGAA
jgi:hypothetical protein